ncbi:MAG: CpcT/CpeT family chromophore lyase [Acidobacteriota bacterium]
MRRLLLGLILGTLVLSPPATASSDKLFDIASILSGTFEGSTPGNHLRLNLRPLSIDPEHPYDLFLEVTGQFEKDNVHQQGVIRLERQGSDIYFTYIPHFDPAITALSSGAGRFTERELTSACSFVVKPEGDGFAGDTLGTTTCALAMRGASGKWSVELEAGNIRLRNTVSGETLRFKQVGKFEKAK